ncbi:adenylyltransferase/cytidyltransferase family protein [Pseudonocardia benzenivorans]|uniref:Cytidyltransferase-related domain protein n=2 Tax=Pseudonocardia TaxID=1847 RepID=F4CQB9_PSEUX|nr:adenylyltransferase/cytidyltransferase family protein [Pseudonocardia dioxanivorans]AEA28392.1 cytidyltransferase-related domain protein [Pseudonocardia dioxanivorans CB1190]GJF02489.1 nicotinamide-nucleotide adenylyltransferase [Pseudonocardia sp. D17]
MRPLGCVTGRFQPVHDQHLELFELVAAECEHLVVAVTNPDSGARRAEPTSEHRHRPEANPFSYFERVRLLTVALDAAGLGDRTTIVPFDLTRPEVWTQYVPRHGHQYVRVFSEWERDKAGRLAAAGYEVTVLDGDAATKRHAADVRALLASGGDWAGLVPPATVPLLRALDRLRPAGGPR